MLNSCSISFTSLFCVVLLVFSALMVHRADAQEMCHSLIPGNGNSRPSYHRYTRIVTAAPLQSCFPTYKESWWVF
ncbi:hypothetical protein OIU77_017806 [Salix suchowensis]|uniref:Secreted protein n=1 Tax=Salix suchowensis TaxID=1278906 RepID=A0ABQ8ZQ95_9ROSI|nr:hypothetical protein OIU77_017806 [Salix suchowensis]